METLHQNQAISFISYHEKQGFILTQEAEQFLMSLGEKKLGIISIVGKYRTGKSFFVNRVLLNKQKNGFNVGPTINPCTKVILIFIYFILILDSRVFGYGIPLLKLKTLTVKIWKLY